MVGSSQDLLKQNFSSSHTFILEWIATCKLFYHKKMLMAVNWIAADIKGYMKVLNQWNATFLGPIKVSIQNNDQFCTTQYVIGPIRARDFFKRRVPRCL